MQELAHTCCIFSRLRAHQLGLHGHGLLRPSLPAGLRALHPPASVANSSGLANLIRESHAQALLPELNWRSPPLQGLECMDRSD